MTKGLFLMAGLLGAMGVAYAGGEPGTLSVHTLSADGAPLPGVTVLAVTRDGVPLRVTTDAHGDGVLGALMPGEYALVALFGGRKAEARFVMPAGGALEREIVFPADAGEVIRIEVPAGASRAAPPKVDGPGRTLPYPDEMVDRNAMAIVWVRVEIDARGKPTGMTILKAPPRLGLEKVAREEVMKMKFRAALDRNGVPTASSMVLALEWAPYWAGKGFNRSKTWGICAGTGPLHLDARASHEVVYFDCSPPKGYEHITFFQDYGKRLYSVPLPGDPHRRFREAPSKSLEDISKLTDDPLPPPKPIAHR
jgi:hypothetical protein